MKRNVERSKRYCKILKMRKNENPDVEDKKGKENQLDKPAEKTKKKRKLLSKVRMCSSFWCLLFVTFTEKTGQHTW